MPQSRSVSRPARAAGICAAVIAALAAGCSRPSDPGEGGAAAERLRRAVLRTLDARNARIVAILSSGETAVVVEGVTSLVGPEASLRARLLGAQAPAVAEVRLTANGAWVRSTPSSGWQPLDPSLAHPAEEASWGALLEGLTKAQRVSGGSRHLTADAAGGPVAVTLDGAGRIVRLRRQRAGIELSLDLSDFGTSVPTDPP